METIHDYLKNTRSAVIKIFEAIDSYYTLLYEPSRPIFTFWGEYDDTKKAEYETWAHLNAPLLELRARKDDEFADEIFAMATLSGTILQFAHKAIELYSHNTKSFPRYEDIISAKHNAIKFCIGREVDEIPIGLIIYAGRNQAHHYDEKTYSKITECIFHDMANWYCSMFKKNFVNDYYDLSNPNVINFANNILYKLDWQRYELYEQDLLAMLRDPDDSTTIV